MTEKALKNNQKKETKKTTPKGKNTKGIAQITRVASSKKVRGDYDNMNFFFGKSSDINELVYTAVDELLYRAYFQNCDIQRAIADKNNLIFDGGHKLIVKGTSLNPVEIDDEGIKRKFNSVFNLSPDLDFENFKKEFNYYRNIFGNVYTYILEDNNGEFIGVQNLDPRFVYPNYDEKGYIISYGYASLQNDSEFSNIPHNRIIHFRNGFNPNDKFRGMSPLIGGIIDILADHESARSNFMFFLNNAIPASLIKMKEGLSDDEIELIMTNFQSQFSGGNNQHKLGVLQGIEGIEQIQKDFKDMEFKIMRDFTTEKVATCLGVPLSRLNKLNVTYNNIQQLMEQYIESTILKEERDLKNHIDKILHYKANEFYNTELYVIDNHIDNRNFNTDLFIKWIDNGLMTPKDACENLGLKVVDEENQSKLYMKQGMVYMEDVGLTSGDMSFGGLGGLGGGFNE